MPSINVALISSFAPFFVRRLVNALSKKCRANLLHCCIFVESFLSCQNPFKYMNQQRKGMPFVKELDLVGHLIKQLL